MKNWKKIIVGCLAVGMLALFGCGGGSGSSAPATATGKFTDAPVVGLSYVSGNQKGVTGADGSFTYEVGKPVKFTIGGIVLGEALAKAQMTPIDLSTTTGADSTTPDVLARVQLLMSLSSTDPDTGTITISETTRTAAKEKTMNFDDSTSTKMQDDLSELVKALAPDKDMVTQLAAKTHFAGTLSKIFIESMLSGKTIYDASNDGYSSNTYKSDGTMTGSGPTTSGTPIEGAGATWAITANGTLQRTSSHGTTTITLISTNMTEEYWEVTDEGSNGTSGTMRMFFNSSTGLAQAQNYYNSIKTKTPPASGFTTAMLAGKSFLTDSGLTVIFNTDGTVTNFGPGATSNAKTWSINSDGQIEILNTGNGTAVITMISSNTTSFTVNTVNSNGTNGGISTFTYITQGASGFTTAMLAGKKLQQTFDSGTATTTYNSDGTIFYTKGTISGTGTWSIDPSGILTVIFNITPPDGLIFSLVQDNGATLIADYKHIGDSVWEKTGDTLTFVP